MKGQDKYKIEFDVPEGYFDSLADRVLDRIEFEDVQKSKHKTLTFKILLSAAAVILGLGIFSLILSESDNHVVHSSSSDYVSLYKSDLLLKSSDATVLDYMSQTFSNSTNYNNDLVEIANDYPSPITFYDEL